MLINFQDVQIRRGDDVLLSHVDFRANAGEFIYIVGRVGSGKSSLLKSFYGELPLTVRKREPRGTAEVLDSDMYRLKRRKTPALRRRLGIVFQDFALLRDRTVRQNLDFVLRSTGHRRRERAEIIDEVLEKVGLPDKIDSFPHELSGGEQQRIAIARALLNDPEIILADEPTGNLDAETSHQIMEILRSVLERGTAVVMVTHNLHLLSAFPGIVYRCEDGEIKEVTDEYNKPIQLI